MTPAPALPPKTAAQEWRAYAMMVLAGMSGVAMTSIPTATLGLFMDPLTQEFGWTRTEISFGLSVFAIVGLPLGPLGGYLVDRFGARMVAIPSIVLAGIAFAGFGLITGAYYQWLLAWTLYTVSAIGIRTLVWSTAISSAFTASRGLALAVLLCGTSLASTLAPLTTNWLIDQFGWRGGYLGLGLGWGGVVLLLVLLFFRDQRSADRAQQAAGIVVPQRHGGLTVRQAFRTVSLYRITIAIFLQSTMAAGMIVHLVPLLTEEGLTRTQGAAIASAVGAGSLLGKLATGWLIDRISGSLIPTISFAGPAIAYLMLLQGGGSTLILTVAAFILGYCAGAALQLTAYLTTRYAGMRNYGTIFGFMSIFMVLSAGVGPTMAGAIFDLTGGYRLLLMIGVPVALTAALMHFRLGSYPVFKLDDEAPGPAGAPATA